jgi:hypothetical protein
MNRIAEAICRGTMDEGSKQIFVRHFSHCNVETKEELIGTVKHNFISVTAMWKGVDRPIGFCWSVGENQMLANRLKNAVESGAVFCDLEVRTNKFGETYVSATNLILGRKMNANLKHLGY